VGHASSDYHVARLRSDPLFDLRIKEDDTAFAAVVFGPKISTSMPPPGALKSKLSLRAEELGMDVPDLVDQTADEMRTARMGQGIVLLGRLYLRMPVCKENARAQITLEISEGVESIPDEIIVLFCLMEDLLSHYRAGHDAGE
jgi:hypothetical protein